MYHSRLGGIIVSSRKCPEKPTLLYRFASFVSRATHSSTIMRKWISLYTTTSNCHRFLKCRLFTVTSVFSATRLPVSSSYEDTDCLSRVRRGRGIKAKTVVVTLHLLLPYKRIKRTLVWNNLNLMLVYLHLLLPRQIWRRNKTTKIDGNPRCSAH